MNRRQAAWIMIGGLSLTALGFGPLLVGEAKAQDSPGPSAKKGGDTPKPSSPPLPKPPPPPEEPPSPDRPRAFMATTDQAIAHYQARIELNPADYISFRHLGEMYERKAKETGDETCFVQAETALRSSLKLLPTYPQARASLAAILCARHKFAEGLEIARKLHGENPKNLDALSIMGDALLEIGQYEKAEKAFQDLYRQAPAPEALARLANLAEMKGLPDDAVRYLKQAVADIRKMDLPKADAWYLMRLGDLAFNRGRIEEAAQHYQLVPDGVDPFHDATFGLSRVRTAQGQFDNAIELAKKAIAIGPDPHMLVHLSELYEKTGQNKLVEPLFDQLIKATRNSPEHRRSLAMFYANYDRELPLALELARKDIAERQDIYGHDALAWALCKNGKLKEAKEAMAQALKFQTQDAMLFHHAGVIHHRLGDLAKAQEYLNRALAINPHFSLKNAAEARKILKSIADSQ